MRADVVVIGAGVGGLTTAALLAMTGRQVVLCEAHGRVGGCAGDYWRKGLLFPAGATLVTGFEEGGLLRRVFEQLGISTVAKPLATAMTVHLPDRQVAVSTDRSTWDSERRSTFTGSPANQERFWAHIRDTAATAYRLSRGAPALPPASTAEARRLLAAITGTANDHTVFSVGRSPGDRLVGLRSVLPNIARTIAAAPGLWRTVADDMARFGVRDDRAFLRFIDLQLLITMQCEADRCVALNGALALDLYRFGTYWVDGGPAGIARGLADGFAKHGGDLRLNARVCAIEPAARGWRVHMADGVSIEANDVVFGIPLPNAVALMHRYAPPLLRWRTRHLPPGWGAIVVSAVVDAPDGDIPDLPVYHQTVESWDRDLAESESAFVSLYPPDREGPGAGRAAANRLRLTISTHTRVSIWQRLTDRAAYLDAKERHRERLLAAAERAIPGVRSRIRYVEVSTPRTFERFTGRHAGMVGGIPQTRGSANLLAQPSRAGIPGIHLCGDTTFPGQGTIGVALSGINAFRAIVDR